MKATSSVLISVRSIAAFMATRHGLIGLARFQRKRRDFSKLLKDLSLPDWSSSNPMFAYTRYRMLFSVTLRMQAFRSFANMSVTASARIFTRNRRFRITAFQIGGHV